MLDAWKKGDKITVTRRKIGGGTERVDAEFQSVISNGRQLWCLIEGKRVRVSISGVMPQAAKDAKAAKAEPAPAKKTPAKMTDAEVINEVEKLAAEPEKESPLMEMAKEAAEEAAAPTGAKVETEALQKPKKETKAPAKKVVSTAGAAKQPNKTERVVVAIAKGKIENNKIAKEVGCDNTLVFDWNFIIATLNKGEKAGGKTLKNFTKRSVASIEKYYNIYLKAKK